MANTPKRKPAKKSAPRKANINRLAQVTGKKTTTTRTVKKPQKPSTPTSSHRLQDIISSKKRELAGTKIHVLQVPYEAQYLAKSLGATYHPTLKLHLYEGTRLPAQLSPYESEPYSLEQWIENEINSTNTPPGIVRMKPRPHQVEAIKKIAAYAGQGWRGFILADNVGVGKSISSLLGAYLVAKQKGHTAANPAKLLITAPKSVLPHWRNTIKSLGIDNLKIIALNYERANKLLDAPATALAAKKRSTVNKHTAEKGKPNIIWDIIIADESQKLKNDSQRSAVFANIARYQSSPKTAPFVIWSSATIGQQPLELGYLAPLIGQMVGVPQLNVDTWGDWLIQNGYHVKKSNAGNFSWIKSKTTDSSAEKQEVLNAQDKDVKRLSTLLFSASAPSLRRNPEDIAGWPTQTYVPTPLQLSNEGDRLYKEIWNEFRKYIGLNPRGKNPKGGLAATQRFRQKASLLSAIPTAEFVNDLLENGIQVAISVEFMETLDVIRDFLTKKGWSVAEFTGRNTDIREEERVRFQKGEAQVIIFSVLEGINLHAGEMLADGTRATSTKRACVVHDIRYSAIDMTQIIGRTTRDGELAVAYLAYTENTIETRVLDVVLNRMKNVRTLSGDDESTLEAIQEVLDQT